MNSVFILCAAGHEQQAELHMPNMLGENDMSVLPTGFIPGTG